MLCHSLIIKEIQWQRYNKKRFYNIEVLKREFKSTFYSDNILMFERWKQIANGRRFSKKEIYTKKMNQKILYYYFNKWSKDRVLGKFGSMLLLQNCKNRWNFRKKSTKYFKKNRNLKFKFLFFAIISFWVFPQEYRVVRGISLWYDAPPNNLFLSVNRWVAHRYKEPFYLPQKSSLAKHF